MEHDWKLIDGVAYQLSFGKQYEAWSKSQCSNCNMVKTIIAGLVFYNPKGKETIEDGINYGETPLLCSSE